MGGAEDQPLDGRNLLVILLQNKEGNALRWEQRGGPNPQTRPSWCQERCLGSVSSPQQGLVLMASPHMGTVQEECPERWQGRHGAMLGDTARLRDPLGPIACSACS